MIDLLINNIDPDKPEEVTPEVVKDLYHKTLYLEQKTDSESDLFGKAKPLQFEL